MTCNGRALPLHPTGTNGECGRRRPLSRLAAAVGAAPDDSGPRAADLRHRRHLDAPLGRRLPVSCDASRRAELRSVSGQQLRSREPPAGAFLAAGAHARRDRRRAGRRATPRVSVSRSTCARCASTTRRRALTGTSHVPHGADGWRRSCYGATRAPAGHFDELLDERRALRPAWEAFAAHAGELVRRAADPRAGARRSADPRERRHLQRLRGVRRAARVRGRSTCCRSSCRRAEWDSARRRPAPARAAAERAWPPICTARASADRAAGAAVAGLRSIPGFLRACHGVRPAGGMFLHLVAFDLARGPDGQWVVLDTRTQAPSGAGYALENRATISRLFPDAFRALRVQALGPFFQALQSTMLDRAPVDDGETPHVVLLTPGPYNETYFEHAYLAKQLGFPLVEGGDLTVRHDRVFLKTVAGLRPVHAILRRLDDDYCDPLELRADSTLGVPGPGAGVARRTRARRQRLRHGRARIAGAARFLPRLRRLLGETLDPPSPAAWCGEPSAAEIASRRRRDQAASRRCRRRVLAVVDATRGLGRLTPIATSSRNFCRCRMPGLARRALASRALMLRVFLVRRPRRLPHDAGGWPGSPATTPHRVGPARRRQQGHLGAVGRAARCRRRPSSTVGRARDERRRRRRRDVEPGGRASVLARALRRAQRELRAAAARGARRA